MSDYKDNDGNIINENIPNTPENNGVDARVKDADTNDSDNVQDHSADDPDIHYDDNDHAAAQNPGIKKLIVKYLIIVASALLIFAVSFAVVYIVFSSGGRQGPSQTLAPTSGPNDLSGQGEDDMTQQGSLIDDIFTAPRKTNFLIIGTDQGGGLSDVIIAGSFDSYTGNIDLVSVPRDTYVELDKEDVDMISKSGRWIPDSGKLTDMHSYAGDEFGNQISIKYVERLLGIKLDYYVEINLEAFRFIVDSVGGVYMDIRKGGYHYDDPLQNLHIHISEGHQLLMGKEAEQLVRFRGDYVRGDVQRIEIQQQFMQAFFEQVLGKESIMNDLQTYLASFVYYVKTDFPVSAITKYIAPIMKLNSDSINFYTLPGHTVAESSLYYIDEEETRELIDATILDYGIGLSDEIRDLNIQVLNGGNTVSFVNQLIKGLKAVGYRNVGSGKSYTGSQKNETRILVREADHAESLMQFFNNPKVELDGDIPEDYDVVIIVGKNEK